MIPNKHVTYKFYNRIFFYVDCYFFIGFNSSQCNLTKFSPLMYSYGHLLTYGYLISPMEMRSLWEAKPTFKILLDSWTFDTVGKEIRSFNAENLGSVCQRAAKLPAIKLWEWFDPRQTRIWADWFEWGQGQAADFFLRPPTLIASNFAAL